MIGFFRRFLTSWAAIALLGLVLIAFVVTGVRDPFGGGSSAGSLAKVGSAQVTEPEFDRLWQREMAKLRQDNPRITPEQAARQGAVDQILDQTIGARALEAFAARQGIAAGDRMLDAEIASAPTFQVAGRFDQRTYESILAQQHLTDREVRDGLRGDILRRQLLAPVGAGATTPEGAAVPYARLILEARQGLIGLVPASAVHDVATPTPADLAGFYTRHKAAFTIPERRSFHYAILDPAMLGAAVPPTQAEIAAYYAAHGAQYGATQKRRLSQAIVQDEATAKQLAAAARGPGGFDAAAVAIARAAPADLALGEKTQAEFAAIASPEVARAVFALPGVGVSDPLKSDLGWHVVHVEAVRTEAGTPLEKARPEIVAALVRERGTAKLGDLSDRLGAAAAKGGATFADLAKRFGLAAQTTPPLTAAGAGPVPLDPALKPLLTAAFQADPGENATIEDLGQGRAALFQTAEVLPPALPMLAQIQPTVVAAWQGEDRARRLRALADTIAQEVRGGRPLAAALAARALTPPQPVALRRIDLLRPGAQVPPPILALFTLPQGGVMPLSGGPAVAYVVQALRIVPGDPAGAPQIVAGVRQQFARLGAEELVHQFARAAQQEVGVRRNAAAIARVRARLSGGANAAQP